MIRIFFIFFALLSAAAAFRLGGFIFVPMVLLSFSSSFHLRYLAVTLPAQALLTAEVWRCVPEKYRGMLSRLEGKLGHRKYLVLTVEERGK